MCIQNSPLWFNVLESRDKLSQLHTKIKCQEILHIHMYYRRRVSKKYQLHKIIFYILLWHLICKPFHRILEINSLKGRFGHLWLVMEIESATLRNMQPNTWICKNLFKNSQNILLILLFSLGQSTPVSLEWLCCFAWQMNFFLHCVLTINYFLGEDKNQ